MDQGHLEEVMPQERLEMVWGRLAGCRGELPERMIARRRRTGCRRELPERMIARRHRTGCRKELPERMIVGRCRK